MHPELFTFRLPEFFHGILPEQITIYTYGAMILLGVIAAFSYFRYHAKRNFGLSDDSAQNLLVGLVLMSFIGGKFLMIFEDPSFYVRHPGELLSGSGFVFYGSLIFSVGFVFWFIRKHRLPAWKFLDLIAFVTLIVHAFGRMGCFFAGCCHGKESDGPFAVIFTDPKCAADPLNTPLHPTQLYSVVMLMTIFGILWFLRKRQSFDGQLFLLYLMLYAVGRSVIEEFRGDEERGFLFDGWYSVSQFISTVLILTVVAVYVFRWRQIRHEVHSSS